MNSRKRAVVVILALLVVITGIGGWSGYRAWKQARKNAALIAASTEPVISYWESPLHPSAPMGHAQYALLRKKVLAGFLIESISQKPFQEVEVPLLFHDGLPYVKVSWAGRQIECAVDTGSEFTMWPQWLHLDTQQLNFSTTQHWPEGQVTRAEWVLTPRIAIGELNLVNVPTEAIGFPRPTPSHPNFFSFPVLGTSVFGGGTVTLDYARKRLTIRNRHYDVTRQPHKPHSVLIHYQKDKEEQIILSGTLAGHKARFVLDSASYEMYVTSSFARTYLSYVPVKVPARTSFDGFQLRPMHNLSGTMAGMPFNSAVVKVVIGAGDGDVLVGSSFFSKNRITIDLHRHVLLIESNR